jgi:DNA-binding MarR family transcriptional regulator
MIAAVAPSTVVALFLRIHRSLSRNSRQVHDEYGISGRKLAALRYLDTAGEATIGELSEHLYVRNSSTSQMVSKLERKGFVQRARSERDNRVVKVSLTPDGQRLVERAPLSGIGLLRKRLQDVPPTELTEIEGVLRRLADLMDIPCCQEQASGQT